MDDSRKRQVQTMRQRYPGIYEDNGRKKHRRGFSDPEIARAAAIKGHEMRRLKKRQLKEYMNADNLDSKKD
jgi:hypothetical protein